MIKNNHWSFCFCLWISLKLLFPQNNSAECIVLKGRLRFRGAQRIFLSRCRPTYNFETVVKNFTCAQSHKGNVASGLQTVWKIVCVSKKGKQEEGDERED